MMIWHVVSGKDASLNSTSEWGNLNQSMPNQDV
jgi:hypothetical protein